MQSEWYVLKGEKVSGPYAKDQLKGLAKTGRIGPTTLVRRGEAGPWTSASDIKGLFPWLNQVPDGPPPDASPRKRADARGPSSQVVLAGGIVGAILVAVVVGFVMKGASSEDAADVDAAAPAEPVVPVVEFVSAANPVAEPAQPVAGVPTPRPTTVSSGPTEFVASPPQTEAVPAAATDDAPPAAAADEPGPRDTPAPELSPKRLLPPVPAEKKPITDKELSEFNKRVALEFSAADAHARYSVFSRSYAFNDEQQARVDSELADWQPKADADKWRLGTRWVAKEEAEQAAREAKALMKQAEALLGIANIDGAIDLLEQASRTNPNAVSPEYYLGLIWSLPFAGKNAPDQAAEHFQKVLQRRPDDPAALNSLGIAQLKQREFNKAIVNFERALELAPASAEVAQNLGRFNFLARAGVIRTGRQKVPDGVAARYAALYAKTIAEGKTREADLSKGWLHMQPVLPDAEQQPVPQQKTSGERAEGFIRCFSGTGFAVGGDHVLTNRHVVYPQESGYGVADQVRIIDPRDPGKKRELVGKVVAIADDADLALVHFPGLAAPALPLRRDTADLGAEVMILGYPQATILGTGLKATTGIVSGLPDPTRQTEANAYIFDATADSGNSGGPVVDKSGRIIGVLTFVFLVNRDLSGGVPAARAAEFVEQHVPGLLAGARPPPEPHVDWSTVVKSAQPSVFQLSVCYQSGVPALAAAAGKSKIRRDAMEDYTCAVCSGAASIDCSNPKCRNGEVRVQYTEMVPILTGAPVRRVMAPVKKYRNDPCDVCNGKGKVDCRDCVLGIDTSLVK